MFICQECQHRFKTLKLAIKAIDSGCPGCGSCDINTAPIEDDQSPENLTRRQKLYKEACITKLPKMSRTGRYGLWQKVARTGRYGLWQKVDDQWQPTGTMGYATENEAEQIVNLRNKIHPDMWRIRERWPVTDDDTLQRLFIEYKAETELSKVR